MNTHSQSAPGVSAPAATGWRAIVARYRSPSSGRAIWQLVNTLLPYAVVWYLMYRALAVSYWLIVPLAFVAAGLLVRAFIISHDCGHGSFMKSRVANHIIGSITGALTFIPYFHWRWEHSIHHKTAGDLNRRGVGDVWTMTVQEYIDATRWRRFSYRLVRNPLILFVVAPLFLFLVLQRIPNRKAGRRERLSVHLTTLGVVLLAAALIEMMGFRSWLLIQLTIMVISSATGVWLFYVQHQFEGVRWSRGDDWNFAAAALEGSSFYKLPKILQWFTGNIGFHHIHHLSPQIPNYHLQRCHNAEPMFRDVPTLTLLSSLRSLRLRLWDEQGQQLVGYRQLRR
jgi:omega-6 fatty acid desaturase (delta-12 desaturase)